MAANINIDVIMKRPLEQKILILAGALVSVFLLYLWLGYLPKTKDLSNVEKQLSTHEAKLNQLKAIAGDLPRFKEEVEKLEKRLQEALVRLLHVAGRQVVGVLRSVRAEVGRNVGRCVLARERPTPQKGTLHALVKPFSAGQELPEGGRRRESIAAAGDDRGEAGDTGREKASPVDTHASRPHN